MRCFDYRSIRDVHNKLSDACDVWNQAIGMPQLIIYAAAFLQATDLILTVFEAVRGNLQQSGVVKLPLSYAIVLFTVLLCAGFTYSAELVRQSVSFGWHYKGEMLKFCLQHLKTGRLVHRLYLNSRNRHLIAEEINGFSLEILLRPLKFTANDMFDFDWNTILLVSK